MGEIIKFPGNFSVKNPDRKKDDESLFPHSNRIDPRRDIEDEWWDAYESGDRERQYEIEVKIGRMFAPGRAGKIIEKLKIIAKIHEVEKKKIEN